MRRQKVTGTIQGKDGRPYWYIVLSYYDDTGKRKQFWETTKIPYPGNKRQAQAYLKQRIEELNNRGGHNINMDMEVTELVDVWLGYVEAQVRANTLERYQLNAVKIKNYYDKKQNKVINYTRGDARTFFNYLMKKGKVNQMTGEREPMAATTVRDIKNVLSMAFEYAVDSGIINSNPIQGIKIKEKKEKQNKIKYMDRQTAEEFIRFCRERNDELTDAIVAAISFGLRRSELLGLRYEDINLPQQYIRISHTVTSTTTIHVEDSTKNATSARIIPITNNELHFFKGIFEKNRKNKEIYGNTYMDNEYVFRWADGRPYRPDYLYKHSKKLLREFGEPELSWHSFRHTYASLLYEQGVDLLEVQRLLGHAPGSDVTLEIYTHIDRRNAVVHSLGLIDKEDE